MNIGFDAKRAFHNKSGLGNYSRDTILALAKYYPQHAYFGFNPKPSTLFSMQMGQEINPATFIEKKLSMRWRTYGIRNYFEHLKLDVYHGLSNELPLGKKSFSTKEVVTIHDLIFLRYPETYKLLDRKIYDKKFSGACKNADVIIATSESTKKDIVRFYNIHEAKIEVVYQSCNDLFLNASDDVGKISTYKLPKNYILSVGTIEDRKNQLLILEAIKDLDIHLVLVGKQKSYTEKLKSYIAKHKMSDRVHFIEQISNVDLLQVYKKAMVFVYPSFYEGFGIPILEAMSAGVPVIASDTSSLPEVGGESVLYFNPSQADELKTALSAVLDDLTLRNSLILKGKNRVQLFSKESMAKKLMRIYQ